MLSNQKSSPFDFCCGWVWKKNFAFPYSNFFWKSVWKQIWVLKMNLSKYSKIKLPMYSKNDNLPEQSSWWIGCEECVGRKDTKKAF